MWHRRFSCDRYDSCHRKLEKQFEAELGMPKNEWSPEEINTFRDRISEMAKSNYFGFDINPDLVKATK